MTVACLHCKTEVPEIAVYCPACGEEVRAAAAPRDPGSRLLAAAAYFTFIPATIFIFKPSFRKNDFVRFHSFQSVFFDLVVIVTCALLRLLFPALILIPHLGFLFAWLLVALVLLGCVMIWLVLVIKAVQGEILQLPLIGSLAERSGRA